MTTTLDRPTAVQKTPVSKAKRPRRSTPLTIAMLAALAYFLLPLLWLLIASTKSAHDLIDSFGEGSPVLVVHGSEDSLIPPSLGQKLYDQASEPKRFLLVEGGSHHNTNAVGQSQYRRALAELFGHKALH